MKFSHQIMSLSMLAQAATVALPAHAAEPLMMSGVAADGFDASKCIPHHASRKYPWHWAYRKPSGDTITPRVQQDCEDAALGRPHIIVSNAQPDPQPAPPPASSPDGCTSVNLLIFSFNTGACPPANVNISGGGLGGFYGSNSQAPLPPYVSPPPRVPLPPRVEVDRDPPPPPHIAPNFNPPPPGYSFNAQSQNGYQPTQYAQQQQLPESSFSASLNQTRVVQPSGYYGYPYSNASVVPGTSLQNTYNGSAYPGQNTYNPVGNPIGSNGFPEGPYDPVNHPLQGGGVLENTSSSNNNGRNNFFTVPDPNNPNGPGIQMPRNQAPQLTGAVREPGGRFYRGVQGPRPGTMVIGPSQQQVRQQQEQQMARQGGGMGHGGNSGARQGNMGSQVPNRPTTAPARMPAAGFAHGGGGRR